MQDYASENLRNVAVVGHGRAGKTSFVDACLFNAKVTKRQGRVDDATSMLDTAPEETKRGMSISLSLAAVEWKGVKINFIDTPGYPDFVSEVKGAITACDTALIVLPASSGVETEAEKDWILCEEMNKPRAFLVNKMDREHADFFKVVDEMRVKFGSGVVPVQIPIGAADTYQGVVDLLRMKTKVRTHDDEYVATDIPESMTEEVNEYKQKLVEALADFNDTLLEKFLNGDEIPEEEIGQALADGMAAAKVFPVYCGSALKNISLHKLLTGIVTYFPAPSTDAVMGVDPSNDEPIERAVDGPFSAQVFKTIVDPFVGRLSFMRVFSGKLAADATVYNSCRETSERLGGLFSMQGSTQLRLKEVGAGDITVTSKLASTKTGDTLCTKDNPIKYEPITYPDSMLVMAVSAKKKGEEEKAIGSIEKEGDEDPTIIVVKDKETKQALVKGIGEVQIDILGERVARKFGVDVEFSEPRVALRETIKKTVKVQGKHKKQSGGHGQYGDVWLEISPLPAGTGNQFTETIFGGSVPRQYIPAVEKGTEETLAQGIIAGYPVVDVKVNLYDGSYHAVDSSEAAFKTATALALKKGVMEANPVLLEPIFDMSILTPEYFTGDVMGQLNGRRARIMGMDKAGRDLTEIKAQIPAIELYKYATDLRAQTKGRGSFTVKFSHYEEMPKKLMDDEIAKYQESKGKASEK
ncbi:MAG: elongation factor G [Schwartzia sp.]|nr:elongation factor G [Schwartzia sp. (in: firmicutes)]